MRRVAWSLLVCTAVLVCGAVTLSACGGGNSTTGTPVARVGAKTTTTSGAPTTTAIVLNQDDPANGVTSDQILTKAPSDDGGKLCKALQGYADLSARMDGADVGEVMGKYGAQMVEILRKTVLPAAPEVLKPDIEALAAEMQGVIDLTAKLGLETVAKSDRAPKTQLDLAAASEKLMTDSLGGHTSVSDDGHLKYAFANYFLAWAHDPCGPKALDWVDTTSTFDSTSNGL